MKISTNVVLVTTTACACNVHTGNECKRHGNIPFLATALGLGRHAPFTRSHIFGRKNKGTKKTTMLLAVRNSGGAGYQGTMEIEL